MRVLEIWRFTTQWLALNKMELIDLNYGNLLYIAKKMRAEDREEIYATRWNNDPEELSASAMIIPDMSWIAAHNGEPVAAFGAIPIHPRVWSVWMFSTDKWPKVALGVTRFIKKTMIPSLKATGALRAECKSHFRHSVAHKWLEMLGATKESTLENYGKNGEDFYLYKWRNK
jgi:hypothetical protein